MSDNFHHGPEIIERKSGAGIVRDVKSAVTMIVGTAPVHVAHEAGARSDYINKRIVIRSEADAVAAFGPETAGYTIPQAIKAIFNKVQNGKGGGTIIAVNVFDPDKHKEGTQPAPEKVTPAQIIGGYDTAGTAYGFTLAHGSYNALGYFPKILIAPGFSTHSGIRAAMDVLANKICAMSIADLPAGLTVQQAVEARGTSGEYNTSSERMILTYPGVKAYDATIDGVALQPFSQHLAGVMIATDLADGYHNSPSNRAMADVLGMERDISFYPGDPQSQTNDLNGAGIVTMMNSFGTGFRTWGNRSAAFPTSITQHNFINARRVLDMIHESALYYLLARTDGLGSRNGLDQVEEDVNAFLRKKIGDDVLYGGRFFFDRDKTTSRDVADGHYYYHLDCQPMGIMERLTVDSFLDISFAKEALGLAE